MIKGIGTDIVEVQRFAQWHTYSLKKLQRIFSDQEIQYCLQSSMNSAQRFAVRFAAKEALTKALTAAGLSFPLLYVCRHALIVKNVYKGDPFFVLSDALKRLLPQGAIVHVSLSHAREYATVLVVIECK